MKKWLVYLSLFIMGGCIAPHVGRKIQPSIPVYNYSNGVHQVVAPSKIVVIPEKKNELKGAQRLILKETPVIKPAITNAPLYQEPIIIEPKIPRWIKFVLYYLIVANFLIIYALRKHLWTFSWPWTPSAPLPEPPAAPVASPGPTSSRSSS